MQFNSNMALKFGTFFSAHPAYATKERHGRAGLGRAAECEKFPLVDDELARPSA